MGIQSGVTLTREEAIFKLREKILKLHEEALKLSLLSKTNEELEDGLEEQFHNYQILIEE